METNAKRALVCDDERVIARLIKANLERRGYEVVVTYDGLEAVERLKSERFDRAYLDVVMPNMDGLEVLAWIRTNDETKDLPVVLLTTQAHTLRESIDEMPHRADALVSKPFDTAELF